MKKKTIISLVAGLLIGSLSAYLYSSYSSNDNSVAFPENGGSFDCGFRAAITVNPETAIKGENGSIYEASWTWTFQNRSDKPIAFSIPEQKYHIVGPRNGRSFVSLSEDLTITTPITLAPNEEIKRTHMTSYFTGEKLESGGIGFEVIAKIDSTLHVLGCAATVEHKKQTEHPLSP